MYSEAKSANAFGPPLLGGDGVRCLLLYAKQLGQWNMTADRMAQLRGPPRWCLIVTDAADTPGAPALVRASLGRGKQVRHILGRERLFDLLSGATCRDSQGHKTEIGANIVGSINGNAPATALSR